MRRGLWIIALAAILMSPCHRAYAACANPAGVEGEIAFNSAYNVPQYCDDVNWIAMVGAKPDDGAPTGCASIGDTCDDGSIYAGETPDGNVPMYTTPADAASAYSWNDGTSNYTDMSMANCTDDSPGTAATCQTGEANTAFLVGATGEPDYPFAAAEYCDGLSAHGYDDWYLPAQDELNVLYTNRNTGDLDGTFDESGSNPEGYYWSSSEYSSIDARSQIFSGGIQNLNIKYKGLDVRCVRRHQTGEGFSQQTQIVPNGLIGHWRLDETSGTTAFDTSGNGNDGSVEELDIDNSVVSPVGTGLDFGPDSISQMHVSLPSDYYASRELSAAFWLHRTGSINGTRGIFEIGPYINLRTGYYSNRLMISATAWSDNGGSFSSSPSIFPLDRWTHFVITYSYNDPLGTEPRIYRDGTLVDTGTWGGGSPAGSFDPPSSNSLMIGRRHDSTNSSWPGYIDDVRFYDRIIGPDEVRQIYQATDGIRYDGDVREYKFFDGNKYVSMTPEWADVTDGLVGHWKLDETEGTMAADSSGNGINGTMQNGLDAADDSAGGAVGMSLAFDGVDDYILTPNILDPSAKDWTASLWAYATRNDLESGSNRQLLQLENGSGTGRNWIAVSSGDGGLYSYLTGAAHDANYVLPLSQWVHISLVHDNASDTFDWYINGTHVQQNSVVQPESNDGDYVIGAHKSSGGRFAGKLDDVRLYDRVVTADEIRMLYNMGASVGSSTALPQGCPSVGDVCDDGTIYAGLYNSEHYYTTMDIPDDSPYNNGNSGTSYVTAPTDNTDGEANTLALAVLDSDSDMAGVQPHQSAQYCYDLNSNGADDWFLGAHIEISNTLCQTGIYPVWQQGSAQAYDSHFQAVTSACGYSGAISKDTPYTFRCLRKGPAPRCANPYGLEGQMVYNEDYDVVQFCDGARWRAVGKYGP